MKISKIFHEDLTSISKHINVLKPSKNNTFLITGATGFIGSIIVKSLLFNNSLTNKKNKIVVLIRNETKFREIFKEFDISDVRVIVGNITDKINYDEDVDFILHCASPTNSDYFTTKPVQTYETIVDGFRNVLDFSKEKDIDMIVNLSTMEVYGQTNSTVVLCENKLGSIDLQSNRSSYPLAKRVTEFLSSATYLTDGLKVCNARLCQTFGAGILNGENRVFKMFADSVISNKDIVLSTDGKSVSTYCYTSDAVRAIFSILFNGNPGETYNVANTLTACSILDMAKIAQSTSNQTNMKNVITENKKNTKYPPKTTLIVSDQKIRHLGWEPKFDLRSMYLRLIGDIEYNTIKDDEYDNYE